MIASSLICKITVWLAKKKGTNASAQEIIQIILEEFLLMISPYLDKQSLCEKKVCLDFPLPFFKIERFSF